MVLRGGPLRDAAWPGEWTEMSVGYMWLGEAEDGPQFMQLTLALHRELNELSMYPGRKNEAKVNLRNVYLFEIVLVSQFSFITTAASQSGELLLLN